ncbi:hypothetical protein [Stutzerimonas azotifigens]|uniref:Uncharacterized protein n=1 Tax=Stutzerimonas azotifigens TaxID=291995 RepID=A0ABR5Z779_9GAMM|nr:hypothetical protein [Stutzerimonas azotifigens]MBA1276080.1 hypothetical protein [Stutzerimonas azotifigens]
MIQPNLAPAGGLEMIDARHRRHPTFRGDMRDPRTWRGGKPAANRSFIAQ